MKNITAVLWAGGGGPGARRELRRDPVYSREGQGGEARPGLAGGWAGGGESRLLAGRAGCRWYHSPGQEIAFPDPLAARQGHASQVWLVRSKGTFTEGTFTGQGSVLPAESSV